MKKYLFCSLALSSLALSSLTLIVSLAAPATAQEPAKAEVYQPNWESLDSRPMPQWWTDAKFGIFIHWGPYSVPAFSKVGEYSEWYWKTLRDSSRVKKGHLETKEFHNRVYGEKFTYPDFVPDFNCAMFDADQWAKLFDDAGAKYVVLTSKHHDGYCLWPNKEAEQSWGRPWDSVKTGPGRDLVGELTTAVRKTDVHMGLYYSLYEWYNPLYMADQDTFVDQHLVPQFKDVVTKYAPEVIFSDGEWSFPHDRWKSTEMLAWLFNESPCKDTVVINDRWGKESRHKHGGYYTTEYGAGLPNAENPWEENRGMAHSFGFSKTENFENYNSTQQLLYMLIDIVSRGGNFLLDIGPTADGRIPVIMQERLIEMGQWLKVNGEAIYGTTPWDKTCQWSEGIAKDSEQALRSARGKYNVMKLTVNPDQGMAVKEIFFTKKKEALYCICAVFPDDKLVVKGASAIPGASVTLLGRDGDLDWKQVGDNIEISMPKVNPSKMPCEHAWTFKISSIK